MRATPKAITPSQWTVRHGLHRDILPFRASWFLALGGLGSGSRWGISCIRFLRLDLTRHNLTATLLSLGAGNPKSLITHQGFLGRGEPAHRGVVAGWLLQGRLQGVQRTLAHL